MLDAGRADIVVMTAVKSEHPRDMR